MRYSPLVLAPALSSALLLPPGLNPTTSDIKTDDIQIAAEYVSKLVRVQCDGCPYKDDGVATDLIFDFKVAAADPAVMTLNDAAVLPVTPLAAPAISAVQVPRDVDILAFLEDAHKYEKAPLDYNLLTHEALVLTDGGYKHDTLELHILAVSGKPVDVNGVRLSVREDLATHALLPESVELLPPGPGCTGLKCMLKAMLGKITPHRKPCGGMKPRPKISADPDHHRPEHKEDADNMELPPHHPHHRPGHLRGPHHHHHSIFSQVVHKVLLPIFIGIVAGLTVSMLGLIVGHVVVMGYRKMRGERMCRRRGQGCFSRRRRAREERRRQQEEAAKGLLNANGEAAEAEAPPAYVDEGLEVVEKE